MVNKELCDRVKVIRENLNLNKSALAKAIGVVSSTISDIERYKIEPSKEVIKNFIVKFDINGKWLFTGEGEAFFNKDLKKINSCSADHVTIPCFDVEAAAGHGNIIETCEKVDEICLSKKFLKENTLGSIKDLAFIKVSGDSMEPTLRDKDFILLDHSIITITSPGIYIFRRSGELFVKRLMKLGNGIINVISDNKELYPSYQIDLSQEDEQNSFSILARAIYHCRKLK